jgi:hypothetical protein
MYALVRELAAENSCRGDVPGAGLSKQTLNDWCKQPVVPGESA